MRHRRFTDARLTYHQGNSSDHSGTRAAIWSRLRPVAAILAQPANSLRFENDGSEPRQAAQRSEFARETLIY